MTAAGEALWIVGAGRLGLSLGAALAEAGVLRALAVSGRRAEPPDHPLFSGDAPAARWLPGRDGVPDGLTGIVIAVPDGAVAAVAAGLASRAIPRDVPVLHTAGALSAAEALAPLAHVGHPVGGLHPLAAVADARAGAERLRGVWWGIEGDDGAASLAARLAEALDGRTLRVAAGGKALYHAAAVFAANYAVTLLDAGEALMARAGVSAEDARPALAALAAGAVENVAARGPAAALTGPVARGDAETVRRHLARLSGEERRVYSMLGRRALALAAAAGLPEAAARAVGRALDDDGTER